MSIERVERTRKRPVYRVRWRDQAGRKRSKSFDLKRDAEAYEAKVKIAKRRGDLDELDAGKQLLDDFLKEWWRDYAEPRLAAHTLRHYASVRNRYINPRLGSYELRKLKPDVVQRFQANLALQGVGQETIRKTLVLLQGVLERAVEWGRIPVNPVRAVRKPPQGRKRTIRAVPPEIVEKLRSQVHLRDATLISVLAYAGLRPGEALGLTWGDVGERTLLVERSLSLGETKDPKTGRSRTVRLVRPLASDLAVWRMAQGRPGDSQPMFPMRNCRFWTDTAYRNWRRKIFQPAAKTAGIETLRPYDLRHSYASLLFAEGTNPAEIAEQMGHSIQTLLKNYTHVMEELRGQKQRPAEALIRQARGQVGPQKAPTTSSTAAQVVTEN